MKGLAPTMAALAVGALIASPAAAKSESYTASVTPPPKIQRAGLTYKVRVLVRNLGAAVHPFCLDFTDDHNSWDITMPGLLSYDSDTFCMRRPLRGGGTRKTLVAYVIPAKAGAHRMSILLSKAEVNKDAHRAFVTDSHALSWGSQFVILGG